VKICTLVKAAKRFGCEVTLPDPAWHGEWHVTWRGRRRMQMRLRRHDRTGDVDTLSRAQSTPRGIAFSEKVPPRWERHDGWDYVLQYSVGTTSSAAAAMLMLMGTVRMDNGGGRQLTVCPQLEVANGPLSATFLAYEDGREKGPQLWLPDPKGVLEACLRGDLCDGAYIDWFWDERGW
jgi:hypothetical protein